MGGVLFQLKGERIVCSEYLVLFQAAKAPGVDFVRWLNAALAMAKPECCTWNDGIWKQRCKQGEDNRDAYFKKFEALMGLKMLEVKDVGA